MKKSILLVTLFLTISTSLELLAQKRKNAPAPTSPIASELFDHLTFRNIGPAFMSGRIADLAVDPTNENIWYVAVASGGVWKTVNAGTTFEPLFDKQAVFATGCVTIDPNDPFVIWVGTGENVGGRHLSFGDGIYRIS